MTRQTTETRPATWRIVQRLGDRTTSPSRTVRRKNGRPPPILMTSPVRDGRDRLLICRLHIASGRVRVRTSAAGELGNKALQRDDRDERPRQVVDLGKRQVVVARAQR